MAEIVDFGLQQHKIKMDSRYFENVLSVVAGDTGRRIEVQLLDTNGMVQDTTGLNLRLNAEIAGKATYTDATLVDATTGKYQLDLSNGMFLAPGNWQFQWQITDSAGKKLHSFAFTGNVGNNISEGGSQATNFYLNLEDLKKMQDDLVNGTIDSSVLETNITEKLTDLETQYAPKLTEVSAQLAQTAKKTDVNAVNERVDNLVIPLSPENANIEVTDAHFSQVKNKTFPSLSKRIEDAEKGTFIPATNIVRNSELQTNAQYWSRSGSVLSVNSGALLITGNGAATYAQANQVTDVDVITGDSYYISSEVEAMSGEPTNIEFDFRGAIGSVYKVGQYTNPSVGVIKRFSNVFIPDSSHSGKITILLTSLYASALKATDSVTSIKRPIIINLTKTYGKGYEPTALEMDEILRGMFADSWFSNTANIFDIGNLLKEQKQIKKAVSEIEIPVIPDDIGAYTGVQKTRGQLITKTNPNTILGGSSYTSEQRPMWTITYDDESDTIYDYAFPVHKAENVPGVFYVVPDKVGTGLQYDWGKADTWERILEMEHSKIGRIEIQHHTSKHLVVTGLTNDELRKNIEYGNELFIEQGIYPRHFAYPYGYNDARVRNVLQEYFETCTSTQLGVNLFSLHPMKIKRRSSDSYDIQSFKAAIDSAVSNNGWLISYQHAIHPSKIVGKDSRACMSPSEMTELIQYAKSKGVDIVSLDDGLKTFAPWHYYFKESQEPVHSIRRNGVEIKPKKTLLVADEFNRVNNATTLGTTDTGQQWSVSGGTWGVDNNTAYQATTGGGVALVSTESDCIIHCVLADTEANEARLIFRYKDADNYWMLRPRGVGYGYELVKREAASHTTPAYKRDVVAKNGDKIKVILDDADIIVFVNDVEICNTVDSHNKEYGKHGLQAAFSNTARWDNFMITSI